MEGEGPPSGMVSQYESILRMTMIPDWTSNLPNLNEHILIITNEKMMESERAGARNVFVHHATNERYEALLGNHNVMMEGHHSLHKSILKYEYIYQYQMICLNFATISADGEVVPMTETSFLCALWKALESSICAK